MPVDAAPANTRTHSGGFKTSEGTIYVSKPFRSKTSKKLRALVTFAPRTSVFDTNNATSGQNEFRGFFSLFWVSIFLFTISTYIRSLETNGYILNLHFATMFSRDAITLAISDAILVASTALCVPFAKAISRGWINYYYTGIILQHTLQATVLFTTVTWTFNRQWPWVQSGFLTLHSLVMMMKMHSYMTVNGELKYIHDQAQILEEDLRKRTARLGGYEKAVADAKAHRAEIDFNATATNSSNTSDREETPLSMTPLAPEGMQSSYMDASAASVLRKRLIAAEKQGNGNGTTLSSSSETGNATVTTGGGEGAGAQTGEALHVHPLVDHPDQEVSAMAADLTELRTELSTRGPYPVKWPENITLKNFAVYQLVPTLVYELEYPRTERIRPLYVFEKTVATFGTFALLYTVTETFILPHVPTLKEQSFFRSLLDLSIPFMMAYLLLFFIIFECICNGFAELSYFADRGFYEDWWNSTSWDEFSRKWNKPVHTFLLRHVYASTITSYKLSRRNAMIVTFLLSACAHELVMVVVTQKIRMYLFLLQLAQIPLIAISRIPVIKKNKLLGNVVFWIGLYAGFPLLCVAYCAY